MLVLLLFRSRQANELSTPGHGLTFYFSFSFAEEVDDVDGEDDDDDDDEEDDDLDDEGTSFLMTEKY